MSKDFESVIDSLTFEEVGQFYRICELYKTYNDYENVLFSTQLIANSFDKTTPEVEQIMHAFQERGLIREHLTEDGRTWYTIPVLLQHTMVRVRSIYGNEDNVVYVPDGCVVVSKETLVDAKDAIQTIIDNIFEDE